MFERTEQFSFRNLVTRNIFGSFADSAVLFPLLVLLGAKGTLSPVMLFLSAGLTYIFAGYFFRIPMPVQPLKSITIAALAVGATGSEIRVSAASLGLICLLLNLCRFDSLMERIPLRIIHQVQLGLGVLLLLQGWRTLGSGTESVVAFAFVLSALFLLLPEWRGLPLMGLFAAAGMVYVGAHSFMQGNPLSESLQKNTEELRPLIVLGLVLPQLALTFMNSVLGTRAAAKVYFPESSSRVTVRSLLGFIGLGNILVAAIGGLPFCHGSGGLTAHVKGGSSKWWSNLVIGGFLLLLAAQSWFLGSANLEVPVILVGSLLFATGVHHFSLARETALVSSGRLRLGFAFFLAFFTQNLLWVLVAALFLEVVEFILGFFGERSPPPQNWKRNDILQ